MVRPDSGAILLDGEDGDASTRPMRRGSRGIGIVYQELSLFPQRSVLANLFVNREPVRRGLSRPAPMEERSRDLLDQLGLHVDVHAPLSRLTIGEQQLVELARVLLDEPRLLILDEPNSALNERETDRLFAVLRQLRARGITMLYVSHRLEEVFAISDRVTVTRNGRDVLTKDRAALTIPEVIEGMIGVQQREALFPPPLPRRRRRRAAASRSSGLQRRPAHGCLPSPRARARSSALPVSKAPASPTCSPSCSALRRRVAGDVSLSRRRAAAAKPDRRCPPRRLPCAGRPATERADARQEHPLQHQPGRRSARATAARLVSASGSRAARAQRQIDALRIKARSPDALANQLSGGNQQKVVIGKWLEIGPEGVPARRPDPRRRRRRQARDLRPDPRDVGRGGIVLFSSTELPELIGLCDRILVLYQGRLAGELSGGDIDNRTLLHLINTGEMPRRRTP